MTTYFEAPDGYGESCLWMPTEGGPWCLLRESDVAGTDRWPDVVARMTGTTITRDALSALCLSYLKPPNYSGGSWTLNPDALADAILAALTGVPHEV